jgi:hypothetical protein
VSRSKPALVSRRVEAATNRPLTTAACRAWRKATPCGLGSAILPVPANDGEASPTGSIAGTSADLARAALRIGRPRSPGSGGPRTGMLAAPT